MTKGGSITENTAIEKDFIITRIFDAPRALVFKAWTDPKHVKEWWGPHYFTIPVCEIDLKVGGAYRIVMHANGVDYPMSGIYRDIKEPERLMFTIKTDEHPGDWHELLNKNRPNRKSNLDEFIATITFEEQDGKTKVTIRKHFDSVEDRDAMVKLGMLEGWTQSLERLETQLAKM